MSNSSKLGKREGAPLGGANGSQHRPPAKHVGWCAALVGTAGRQLHKERRASERPHQTAMPNSGLGAPARVAGPLSAEDPFSQTLFLGEPQAELAQNTSSLHPRLLDVRLATLYQRANS
jgi:hypothetical protein